MAPAVVAVVVPPSAWMQPARARRKPLKRRLQLLPAMQWKYIAPTIPAATDRPKLKVIRYERKLKLAPPLVIYPPPTGPPSADRALAAPFQNRTIASRRQIKVAPVYAPAAAPAVVPRIPATKVIDRRDIRRTLKKAPPQPVFPLAASVAPVAALITPPRKRRKARRGLFLTSGGDTLSQAPTGTPAVYPSFVPVGFRRREETERTLRRLVPAPVYPATPVVVSADRALVAAFQTNRIRSRKRITAPEVIGVGAAAPVTSPAVPAALLQPKTKRRKSRQGLFLGGTTAVDGYTPAPAAQPEPAWRLPKKHVVEYRRKLKREPVQPQFPQTPPVPAQPEGAWRQVRSRYIPAQYRKHLFTGGPLHVEAAPPPTEINGPEYKVSIKRRRR